MNILSFTKNLTLKSFITVFFCGICMMGEAKTILVFGDSLSAGYGLQAQEDWPYLLQQKLTQEKSKYQVINASISGETTEGGLLRFEPTFNKHKPDIVILELGANDGLRGLDIRQMHSNLNKMIEYSLKHHAKVLLVGMKIPPNYGKRYTDSFHLTFTSLKEEKDIALIPFLLEGLAGQNKMIQNDGMHPNATAQPVILETVLKSLKPLLQ